jgi:hypothetical protein
VLKCGLKVFCSPSALLPLLHGVHRFCMPPRRPSQQGRAQRLFVPCSGTYQHHTPHTAGVGVRNKWSRPPPPPPPNRHRSTRSLHLHAPKRTTTPTTQHKSEAPDAEPQVQERKCPTPTRWVRQPRAAKTKTETGKSRNPPGSRRSPAEGGRWWARGRPLPANPLPGERASQPASQSSVTTRARRAVCVGCSRGAAIFFSSSSLLFFFFLLLCFFANFL